MEIQTYKVNLVQRKPPRGLEEALSEVERELRVRERCFSRWVQDGKLTRIDAVDRVQRLESAWLYLDKMLTIKQPETVPSAEESAEGPKEGP